MKTSRALALSLAAAAALPAGASAAAFTTVMSGPWTSAYTWSADGESGVPGVGDTVTIATGNTVGLMNDTSIGALTVAPGGEVAVGGNTLTTTGLAITSSSTAGKVTSDANGSVVVNGGLDLGNASITGADVTATPGTAGVVLRGSASVTKTLTVAGPATVTFQPRAVNATTPLLTAGAFATTGNVTGVVSWADVTPANGDKVSLVSTTTALSGFTVSGGDRHTVAATATSLTATWSNPPAPTATDSPKVTLRDGTGDAVVAGDALVCQAPTASSATTTTYAWTRDGSVIPGKEASNYTPSNDDAGRTLRCRVTFTGTGGSLTVESDPVSVSALIYGDAVFAAVAGTKWTGLTPDAQGVYGLPVVAPAGWTPKCSTLTGPGAVAVSPTPTLYAKTILSDIGTVGCTQGDQKRLTFAPNRDITVKTTWTGSVTLFHRNVGVVAPITLTVDPSVSLAPRTDDVPSPGLSSAGIGCPAGTDARAKELTVLRETRAQGAAVLKAVVSPLEAQLESDPRMSASERRSLVMRITAITAEFAVRLREIDAIVERIKGGGDVSAATCVDPATGAEATNAAVRVDSVAITGDVTSQSAVLRIAGVDSLVPSAGTATIAAVRRPAKPRLKVVVMVFDRAAKAGKGRMVPVSMRFMTLTRPTTRVAIPRRVRVGRRTVAVSRDRRVAVVVLGQRGKRQVPSAVLFPR